MEKEEQSKPKAVISGLIIFSKHEGLGHIAIQNCSADDVADCILSAMACLSKRNLTPSQIFALLDKRAQETNIKWGGHLK